MQNEFFKHFKGYCCMFIEFVVQDCMKEYTFVFP